MSTFRNAVVSLPGKERLARTPFGAKIVIHATAAETEGAFGMWEPSRRRVTDPLLILTRGRPKSFA